jgi:hypothetical protein
MRFTEAITKKLLRVLQALPVTKSTCQHVDKRLGGKISSRMTAHTVGYRHQQPVVILDQYVPVLILITITQAIDLPCLTEHGR